MSEKSSSKKQIDRHNDSTSKKQKKASPLYILYKNNMFELYVSLTNMYWLVCVMQSHKMRKFDNIISYLSAEECKSLMGK